MEILIFLILLIAATVFNFAKSRGRNRKVVFIANIALLSVAASMLVWGVAEFSVTENDRKQYDVYSGGLLGSITYMYEDDSYYYISHSALTSSMSTAVPKAQAEKSWTVRNGSHVMLYTPRDVPTVYDADKRVGSFYIDNATVKIVSDFSDLRFIVCFITACAFMLFNVVEFFVVLVSWLSGRKAASGEALPENNGGKDSGESDNKDDNEERKS